MHITKDNKYKIAFYTCYRLFEWAIIPFGLTNLFEAF